MTQILVANLPNPPLIRTSFLVTCSEVPFTNVEDLSKAITINRPLDIVQYLRPGSDVYGFTLFFGLDRDHVFDNIDERGTESTYYTVPQGFVILREIEAREVRHLYALPVDVTLCRCSAISCGYPSVTDALHALERHANLFNTGARELKERTEEAYTKMLEHTRS